jgi:DNA-binding NarL/FixJ family response regulator
LNPQTEVATNSQAPSSKLRLLVLDDHALFSAGLSRALSMEPDMTIVAECPTVGDAVTFVQNNAVDIVLLDLDLAGEAGQDFLARTPAETRPKVLVVAGEISAFHVEHLIRNGVDGLQLKTESLGVLCEAIRRVGAGEKALDSAWLKPMIEGKRTRVSGEGPFTAREREVLRGVLQGLSSKEIAHRSLSSEAAVKSVIQQLFHKTGTRSRAQLVRLTIETGAMNDSSISPSRDAE